MVADYTNIPVSSVGDLDIIDYLILRRDAVISAFSRTEKGIEYLNAAWAYEQTDIDRDTLRGDFGTTTL